MYRSSRKFRLRVAIYIRVVLNDVSTFFSFRLGPHVIPAIGDIRNSPLPFILGVSPVVIILVPEPLAYARTW